MQETERLTRKQRRVARQQGEDKSVKLNFRLKHIEPMTGNQKRAFESYAAGKNLMLHGIAGTGKSFVSSYLAMRDLLDSDRYKRLVIIRSVVPTRDMGFLPGSNKDKSKVYEAPYYAIFTELFERGDAYEYMKNKGIVEFMTTSFIRGVTLNDCIIVVDEIANMTLHELDSVITRVGKNCRIMFSGDFRQSDFTKQNERDGLKDFMRIIDRMKGFDLIEFDENDIVRSSMVKDYIITKDRLGIVA